MNRDARTPGTFAIMGRSTRLRWQHRGAVAALAALVVGLLAVTLSCSLAVPPRAPSPVELFESMGSGRAVTAQQDAARLVLAAATDHHPLLVRAAIGIAGDRRDEEAEAALAVIVAGGPAAGGVFDDLTRIAAANALGRIGSRQRSPPAASVEAPAIASPAPAGAAGGVFRGLSKGATDRLLQCSLASDDWPVRVACMQALGRGRVEQAAATLKAIREDPAEDPRVVLAAARALSALLIPPVDVRAANPMVEDARVKPVDRLYLRAGAKEDQRLKIDLLLPFERSAFDLAAVAFDPPLGVLNFWFDDDPAGPREGPAYSMTLDVADDEINPGQTYLLTWRATLSAVLAGGEPVPYNVAFDTPTLGLTGPCFNLAMCESELPPFIYRFVPPLPPAARWNVPDGPATLGSILGADFIGGFFTSITAPPHGEFEILFSEPVLHPLPMVTPEIPGDFEWHAEDVLAWFTVQPEIPTYPEAELSAARTRVASRSEKGLAVDQTYTLLFPGATCASSPTGSCIVDADEGDPLVHYYEHGYLSSLLAAGAVPAADEAFSFNSSRVRIESLAPGLFLNATTAFAPDGTQLPASDLVGEMVFVPDGADRLGPCVDPPDPRPPCVPAPPGESPPILPPVTLANEVTLALIDAETGVTHKQLTHTINEVVPPVCDVMFESCTEAAPTFSDPDGERPVTRFRFPFDEATGAGERLDGDFILRAWVAPVSGSFLGFDEIPISIDTDPPDLGSDVAVTDIAHDAASGLTTISRLCVSSDPDTEQVCVGLPDPTTGACGAIGACSSVSSASITLSQPGAQSLFCFDDVLTLGTPTDGSALMCVTAIDDAGNQGATAVVPIECPEPPAKGVIARGAANALAVNAVGEPLILTDSAAGGALQIVESRWALRIPPFTVACDGDGVCEPGIGESCGSCPNDCPSCCAADADCPADRLCDVVQGSCVESTWVGWGYDSRVVAALLPELDGEASVLAQWRLVGDVDMVVDDRNDIHACFIARLPAFDGNPEETRLYYLERRDDIWQDLVVAAPVAAPGNCDIEHTAEGNWPGPRILFPLETADGSRAAYTRRDLLSLAWDVPEVIDPDGDGRWLSLAIGPGGTEHALLGEVYQSVSAALFYLERIAGSWVRGGDVPAAGPAVFDFGGTTVHVLTQAWDLEIGADGVPQALIDMSFLVEAPSGVPALPGWELMHAVRTGAPGAPWTLEGIGDSPPVYVDISGTSLGDSQHNQLQLDLELNTANQPRAAYYHEPTRTVRMASFTPADGLWHVEVVDGAVDGPDALAAGTASRGAGPGWLDLELDILGRARVLYHQGLQAGDGPQAALLFVEEMQHEIGPDSAVTTFAFAPPADATSCLQDLFGELDERFEALYSVDDFLLTPAAEPAHNDPVEPRWGTLLGFAALGTGLTIEELAHDNEIVTKFLERNASLPVVYRHQTLEEASAAPPSFPEEVDDALFPAVLEGMVLRGYRVPMRHQLNVCIPMITGDGSAGVGSWSGDPCDRPDIANAFALGSLVTSELGPCPPSTIPRPCTGHNDCAFHDAGPDRFRACSGGGCVRSLELATERGETMGEPTCDAVAPDDYPGFAFCIDTAPGPVIEVIADDPAVSLCEPVGCYQCVPSLEMNDEEPSFGTLFCEDDSDCPPVHECLTEARCTALSGTDIFGRPLCDVALGGMPTPLCPLRPVLGDVGGIMAADIGEAATDTIEGFAAVLGDSVQTAAFDRRGVGDGGVLDVGVGYWEVMLGDVEVRPVPVEGTAGKILITTSVNGLFHGAAVDRVLFQTWPLDALATGTVTLTLLPYYGARSAAGAGFSNFGIQFELLELDVSSLVIFCSFPLSGACALFQSTIVNEILAVVTPELEDALGAVESSLETYVDATLFELGLRGMLRGRAPPAPPLPPPPDLLMIYDLERVRAGSSAERSPAFARPPETTAFAVRGPAPSPFLALFWRHGFPRPPPP